MRYWLLTILLVGGLTQTASAQDPFFYPAPTPGQAIASKDVPYGVSGSVTLKMDVYRPAQANGSLPALIFFSQSVGAQRAGNTFYVRWAETAAMNDLVSIVPDLRQEHAAEDFGILLSHLAQKASEYGIDREALAVYAGSGNVSAAFPLVEDVKLTAVKAAVMYYGSARIASFRPDLPVLLVRAGLDRPSVNTAIASLAAAAVSQNAPLTLLNHPTGHHAFEMIDDDAATRAVIDRTIAFVKHATSASYQSALRAGLPEVIAAGHFASGNFSAAVAAYARLAGAKPADASLGLSYGEALLADKQFAAACRQFETLQGKGLGPRDLGLPAARACVQSGDADRGVKWLQSIPQRFLPLDVQNEPAFAALQQRADFVALFRR
jgi:hypothetical protein